MVSHQLPPEHRWPVGHILGRKKVGGWGRLLSRWACICRSRPLLSWPSSTDRTGREGPEPAPSVSICRLLPMVGGAASVRPQSQAINMEMWAGTLCWCPDRPRNLPTFNMISSHDDNLLPLKAGIKGLSNLEQVCDVTLRGSKSERGRGKGRGRKRGASEMGGAEVG